jgi:hypothetical protein
MEDKEIYIMMEINYLKENKRKLEDNNEDLFPLNWYKITDYKLKTEILHDAIKNKVKIKETKKYNNMSCIK